jgi:hypothetical protein
MRHLSDDETCAVSGGEPLPLTRVQANGQWQQQKGQSGTGGGQVTNVLLFGVYVDREGDGVMDLHFQPGAEIYGEDSDGNGYVDWFEEGYANGHEGTADTDGLQIWRDNIS